VFFPWPKQNREKLLSALTTLLLGERKKNAVTILFCAKEKGKKELRLTRFIETKVMDICRSC